MGFVSLKGRKEQRWRKKGRCRKGKSEGRGRVKEGR
jgi:hypothetical protein